MDFMDLERQRGITIQVRACNYVLLYYNNYMADYCEV